MLLFLRWAPEHQPGLIGVAAPQAFRSELQAPMTEMRDFQLQFELKDEIKSARAYVLALFYDMVPKEMRL